MSKIKKYLNRVFIDGLSGMALGLFSTLIIGTILQQIANLIGGDVGDTLFLIGKGAASLTGAGIGCGVAYKFKESPLVVLSAATAGMIGAFASKISAGAFLLDSGVINLAGPGEPLGAFVAAYVGIELGHLVSGKTKLDILVTPSVSIISGSLVGLLVGSPISAFMSGVGEVIEFGTNQQPFLMGIIVSVLMGIALTLPISSAAIGLALGLSGISAGAATVGCAANMIGFAVASYRENKLGGLFAQGIGTSMLQVSNIYKKPIIWLPAIISSAILGPIATMVFRMTNNSIGSGMGTSGLVGQIMTFQTMVKAESAAIVLTKIALLHFILPALLALIISEFMRKKKWIKSGDMKLEM
ncbi:MAG TPA: PTS sugar transporter subunit IIC [Mobilitalea sp.]|nr:PTS sugar transporter subunit IIC [Mobilitalea sp.]